MSKQHRVRNSILGVGNTKAYAPLAGTSFSSQRPPIYDAGGFHDREGLPTRDQIPQLNGKSSQTMYLPNTRWTWAFMLIVLAQAIVSLALEAYIFGEFQVSLKPVLNQAEQDMTIDGQQPKETTKTIPTYLALFIFGYFYELVLAWDALRLKNTIQVIGICIYNLGMVIYSAVQMSQVKDAVIVLEQAQDIEQNTWWRLKAYLVAAPCVVAVGTIHLSYVAWKLYNEFAWTIYKHISADLRLKRRYLTYQIYIALLKFDFFFFLGFTVQFLVVVTNDHDPEFYLTIAAVPVTIVILLLAAWFTRRETYAGQVGIIFIYFAAMAYFVFKLVRMWTPPREIEYLAIRPSLTTFAVLTINLLIVTIVTAVFCMINFNKGLKPHLQRRKVPNTADLDDGKWGSGPYNGPPHPLGSVPTRMTID